MFQRYWKCYMIVFLFPFLLIGKETDPAKIIQNVEKKLNSAKSVQFEFKQTYIWELTGEEQTIEGELLLQGDDQFYIMTEDQVIVADGTTLWTYSKPSQRVLVDRLNNSDNTLLPRQILLQYTEEYTPRTIGEEVITGQEFVIIQFLSENRDVFFPEVRVWIEQDSWIPRKIEQTDINDNRTIYNLDSVEFDLQVDIDFFQFVIPEGVEVIDMR